MQQIEQDLSSYREQIEQSSVYILYTEYQIKSFIQHYFDIWSNAFIFSIVRNPYDKLVSGWKYMYDIENITFLQALESTPVTEEYDNSDLLVKYYHFTIEQHKLLNMYDIAITDNIIKLENYTTDTINMFKKLNIDIVEEDISHTNNSNKEEYVLSAEEIEIINERYYKDFKLLGYHMI